MPVSTTIQVAGVKDAINNLKKLDPELQKEFKTKATDIAQPAIDAGKKAYEVLEDEEHPYALSGMSRRWTSNGRKIFPFRLDKAIKGVQMKFDTRRKAVGVILIIQKDVATAVFETAGRKTSNKLGAQLGAIDSGKTRLLQPAVDGAGVDAHGLGGGESAAGLLVYRQHGLVPVAFIPREEAASVIVQ